MHDIFIEAFNYPLAPHQIADFPLPQRDASQLLIYREGKITDDTFTNLPQQLPQGATLVLNNTRVIEARIFFQKLTGGIIELFCLQPFTPADISLAMQQTQTVQWRCLVGGASKWKPGQVLQKEIEAGGRAVLLTATYLSKEPEDFIIALSWGGGLPFATILEAAGAIPLPPYIKRKAEYDDAERYQTVFAEHKGSVAAPTAALHFSQNVFTNLAAKDILPQYITLHVGAGTFKPVKTETISAHHMHEEHFSVTADLLRALLTAKTIVSVGTTSLRTLESLYWIGIKINNHNHDLCLSQWEAYELDDSLTYEESLGVLLAYLEASGKPALQCRTSLLIRPGYRFRSAQALITNFHQPRSTLLLLVAAFIGDDWRKVYDHALAYSYRFLSYGDSSLLWRKD
jgi:S-adenosylmethionine:tRNA ribosyltransferase-isomerase